MKKFLCILLCLLLLAGCGADAAVEEVPEAVFPEMEIVESAPVERTYLNAGYLAYEAQALPDCLEYVAAQCLAGARLYVGGRSRDGAVLAWTDLNGGQGTVALPEGAEWIMDLCPAEGGFWLLCGSLPRMCQDWDGNLMINGDPKGTVFLAFYHEDGTLGETLALTEAYPDISFRQVLPVDGGFLLLSDECLVRVDRDGREQNRLTLERSEDCQAERRFRELLMLNGRLYVLQSPMWDSSDVPEDHVLLLLDPETLETGEGLSFSCDLYGTGWTADGQWFLNCEMDGQSGLVILDPEAGTFSWLVDWADLGMVLTAVETALPWGSGYVLLERYGTQIGLLRWMEGQKPEPVTLTMAVTGHNGMDQMVREFNLSQDRWRIVTYSYGDPMTGGKDLDVLRTELLAGNAPDLYCFCDQGAGGGVANGGIDLLKFGMDLLPLLDQDPEFGQDDLLPSLLEAMQQDGCLYGLPLAFTMTTCKALSSLIAEPGVTFEELEQVREQAGDGWVPFASWNDVNNLLGWTAPFCAGAYVDRDAGTCRFDCQEFVDYLTWCRTWAGNGDFDPEEKTILTMFPIQSTETVRQGKLWWDGYTYAGIPCYEGNGSMFELAVEIGISRQTEHADGAWAFIHYCLTRQDSGILYGIPVLQSVIEDQVESYVEADAQKERGVTAYATRADADQFYELLNTTTVVGGDDQALLEIIKEEAEFYFQGSHTAEETAKIIQDRASLYVMEQYG